MGERVDLYLGSPLGRWALDQVRIEEIATVVSSDPEIADAARARGFDVILGAPKDRLNKSGAPLGLSVHYPHIFSAAFLARYRKMYNLHPGYLPWGRGFYPVFWALWERAPAGATLHEIDPGVDTGPLVAQMRVEYDEYDTGASLHRKVREAEECLFREYWPRIAGGEELPSGQQQGAGSYHSKAQFFARKRPADWRSMRSEDLLRLARALSFPGYSGLEIEIDGRITELSVRSD